MDAPARRPLPRDRKSVTHKFKITDSNNVEHKGYIHVGFYDDGAPGELFIKVDKQGSLLSGLLDGLAISASMALQYGVPLTSICSKWRNMAFEPGGRTEHETIRRCTSVLDYIARWLELKFVQQEGGSGDQGV